MDVAKIGEEFIREVIGRDVRYLKSIWHLPKKSKEISLAVLIDDTEEGFSRDILGNMKLRAAEFTKKIMKSGDDFVVHFHLLTDYWEQVRHGNPVLLVEIKESVPIYDKPGFFVPMQRLIKMGRVPGTKESLRAIIASAPFRFHTIKNRYYIDIVSFLFESVVDSAQSLLMLKGVSPPVPKKVPEKLKTHVPDLQKKYIDDATKIIKFWKRIEHGELKLSQIKGRDIDDLIRRGFDFIDEMERLMEEE